jgi:rhamnosyltransferase
VKIVFKNKGSGSAGQNFFSLMRDCNSLGYDYIAFSDQDDIWHPDKLSSGIKLLEESEASAYSSSASAFWPSGSKRILKQSNVQRSKDYLFEGAGQGCTFILKNDFFSEIQIFCQRNRFLTDQFYYHDWLVYILARSWNKVWAFDVHSFIEYRQHESNDTGARKGIESIKNRVNLIANGWYKNQIGLAIQIAQIASGNHANLSYIADLYSEKDSIRRRINLMIFVLMNGRRKLSDRFVLIIAGALRWI